MKKKVPAYNGTLRDHTIMCPYCISECSGIRIFGKRIKSIAFSTDVAIIKNINAGCDHRSLSVYSAGSYLTVDHQHLGCAGVCRGRRAV